MPSMVGSSVRLGLEQASNMGASKNFHVADKSLKTPRSRSGWGALEKTAKSVIAKATEKIIITCMTLIHRCCTESNEI